MTVNRQASESSYIASTPSQPFFPPAIDFAFAEIEDAADIKPLLAFARRDLTSLVRDAQGEIIVGRRDGVVVAVTVVLLDDTRVARLPFGVVVAPREAGLGIERCLQHMALLWAAARGASELTVTPVATADTRLAA